MIVRVVRALTADADRHNGSLLGEDQVACAIPFPERNRAAAQLITRAAGPAGLSRSSASLAPRARTRAPAGDSITARISFSF